MEIPGLISVLVVINLVRSLFFCNMAVLLFRLPQLCVKSMSVLLAPIKFISPVEALAGAHEGEVALSSRCDRCSSCKRSLLPPADGRRGAAADLRRGAPTGADIELVLERLGMRAEEEEEEEAQKDGRCRDCFLVEAAEGMMQEEASVAELAAAFSVFDRDGDGFIGPEELRDVMWRLGLQEGVEVEGCRRMIRAFDEDGDGKIDLAEFRKLLECAA